MKYKIQEFTYCEDTGVSTMLAVSKYGNLYAEVKCAEEDKHLQNQWDGYRFCEYKIALQYLKYYCLWLEGRYKAVYDAVETVNDYLRAEDEDTWRLLQRIVNQGVGYEKIYKEQRQKYLNLKKGYKKYCTEILNLRSEFRSIHEGE